MELNMREHGSVLVLEVVDKRLDAHGAPDFRSKLLGQIDGGQRRVVVNLGNVGFIDSSGLGAMVSGLKRLGRDGDLKVCAAQPAVRTMFELTRLHRVISIFPTEDEAVKSFDA